MQFYRGTPNTRRSWSRSKWRPATAPVAHEPDLSGARDTRCMWRCMFTLGRTIISSIDCKGIGICSGMTGLLQPSPCCSHRQVDFPSGASLPPAWNEPHPKLEVGWTAFTPESAGLYYCRRLYPIPCRSSLLSSVEMPASHPRVQVTA